MLLDASKRSCQTSCALGREVEPAVSISGRHRRNALCAGARCHWFSGAGTFQNGVLMPTRLQVLRERAFQLQHGRCWYCGAHMWLVSPDELTCRKPSLVALAQLRCSAEHLRAQCDGGRDTAANVVAACLRCNRTRHQRKRPPEPMAFRAQVRQRMARGAWHDAWVHAFQRLNPASELAMLGSIKVRPAGRRELTL